MYKNSLLLLIFLLQASCTGPQKLITIKYTDGIEKEEKDLSCRIKYYSELPKKLKMRKSVGNVDVAPQFIKEGPVMADDIFKIQSEIKESLCRNGVTFVTMNFKKKGSLLSLNLYR